MTIPVSFRVTTYKRLKRNEAGLTKIESRRLNLGDALDMVLAALPDEAVTITSDLDDGHDSVTVVIDWLKVPTDIRAGARKWPRSQQ